MTEDLSHLRPGARVPTTLRAGTRVRIVIEEGSVAPGIPGLDGATYSGRVIDQSDGCVLWQTPIPYWDRIDAIVAAFGWADDRDLIVTEA
jgi:hypothetical protein